MDYDGHKAKKEKSPKELMPNLLALELPSHVIVVKGRWSLGNEVSSRCPLLPKATFPLRRPPHSEREREIVFPHHLPLEYL